MGKNNPLPIRLGKGVDLYSFVNVQTGIMLLRYHTNLLQLDRFV